MSSDGWVEAAKERAAKAAVDAHLLGKENMVVGVGTGTTARHLINYLAELYHAEPSGLPGLVCIPTSTKTKNLLLEKDMPVKTLEDCPVADICIDGADEVDSQLNLIKGGGGALLEEKIVQSNSTCFAVVADIRKKSRNFGDYFRCIPLEVMRAAHYPIKLKIEESEGGKCKLRMVGEDPYISNSGNYILDWFFPTELKTMDLDQLDVRLHSHPGLLETGLFLGVADYAYFAKPDNTVEVLVRKKLTKD